MHCNLLEGAKSEGVNTLESKGLMGEFQRKERSYSATIRNGREFGLTLSSIHFRFRLVDSLTTSVQTF